MEKSKLIVLFYYCEYLIAILNIESINDKTPLDYYNDFLKNVISEHLSEFSNELTMEEFEYETYTLESLSEFDASDSDAKLEKRYQLLLDRTNRIIHMINDKNICKEYIINHSNTLILINKFL
jgi:hypothetical protein